ncbi:hypothetical protein Bint_1120 [Brachyspira intermedia PWS/A]|uniref:Uncharacterized protein n=1 Tax=Brachyspira intermedia (strain ATCC 51140 / PWS/A) TaxID=1045858 RepID=G0EMQ5_BRAIP|nr:hypothetical protein [Brachyspira intermedia]AEM21743.1 hypothetical protein Bint_1120 [Brachyspira intermedia PWS/A]
MRKKILYILLVLTVICSSAFAYNNNNKSIVVITFQGPVDIDNVTLSNLFEIELINLEGIKVKSGKGLYNSSYDRGKVSDSKEYYRSLYSSTYENEAIKIAKYLRSDYVLIGQINKLGNKKRLVIRVIDTNRNHIAGAQCTFENPEDIAGWIATMSKRIVDGINNSSKRY